MNGQEKLVLQMVRWALEVGVPASTFEQVAADLRTLNTEWTRAFKKQAKGMKFKTPGNRALAQRVFMLKAIRTLLER
jgi:hypothetical protein